MRFPWLQVDLDFLTAHSRDLAVLLGVSRREAIGVAMDLWTWVLGRASAERPPDGLITGTKPARLIAGAVDWTGDEEALVQALVGAGMAELVANGVRIRGLSRYKRTWEKNNRRTTGPGPAKTGTKPAPKTQTQTQTQTQKVEDLPGADAPAPRGELRLEPPKAPRKRQTKPDKPTDPRHAPLVKQLVEVHGWPFDGPKDAAQVTALLALADQQEATRGERAPGEVLRRAQIARAQSGFYSARTLCDFRNAWGRFEKPQQSGAGPPPVSDWSNRLELPPPPEDDLPL